MSLCLPVSLSDNCQCKLLFMAFKQAFSIMSLLHRHKLLTTIIGKYLVEVCVSIPLQQLEGTDSLPGSLKYCVIVGRHAIAINFGTNLIYSPVACSLSLCVLAPRTHLYASRLWLNQPPGKVARFDWIMEITDEMAWTANDEITNQSIYGHQPCHVISCHSIRSLALHERTY